MASSLVPLPSGPRDPSPEDDFPEPVPVRFSTIKELFDLIDRRSREDIDVITVTDVSPENFQQIENARSESRRHRWRRYDVASKTLVVVLPTGTHERLHRFLDMVVHSELYRHKEMVPMGMSPLGMATFRSPVSGGVMEGDSTSEGPSRKRFPSFVILSAHSQSLESLRKDMRWWFRATNHEVKIILLSKLNRKKKEIVVEKWVELPTSPRQGATTTRTAAAAAASAGVDAAVRIHCDQVINITGSPGVLDREADRDDPASYIVTGDPLRLELDRLLFPLAGLVKEYVTVDNKELQILASDIDSEMW